MEGLFGERRRALGALSTLRGKGGRGEELVTCAACGGEETRETMHRSGYVCPRCGCHLRVSAQYRLHSLFDQGVYRELEAAPLPPAPPGVPREGRTAGGWGKDVKARVMWGGGGG